MYRDRIKIAILLRQNPNCEEAKKAKADILNGLGEKLSKEGKHREAIAKYLEALKYNSSEHTKIKIA